MPLANPYQKYQNASVQTADKGQLLLLTYEAILRWLKRAETAIDENNVVSAHEALLNTQTLIRDLSSSLDVAVGGEVAVNLARLYDFMIARLVEANIHKDKVIIDQVRQLVSPLFEAWRTAVLQARRQGLVAAL